MAQFTAPQTQSWMPPKPMPPAPNQFPVNNYNQPPAMAQGFQSQPMGYQKPNYHNKYPKQEAQRKDVGSIREDIRKRLSDNNYVLSLSKDVNTTMADKSTRKYTLKVPKGGLKEFQLPTQPHDDIFSLYFSVPIKVAEEQRRKEEEERKKAEEEKKRLEEERKKAAKKTQGPVSIEPIPREQLPEDKLQEILDGCKMGDRQVLQA